MEQNLVKRKKGSGDVVDRTMVMMEMLFKDCPTPTQEEFKRMAGMQMAFMNALSMNLMNSMTGNKKLDRGLLRLSMKASEQCLKAVQVGAGIDVSVDDAVKRPVGRPKKNPDVESDPDSF